MKTVKLTGYVGNCYEFGPTRTDGTKLTMCKCDQSRGVMIPSGYVVSSNRSYIADESGSMWTSDFRGAHVFGDDDANRICDMWQHGGHAPRVEGVQVFGPVADG